VREPLALAELCAGLTPEEFTGRRDMLEGRQPVKASRWRWVVGEAATSD
jgi:hypothetical protein